MNTPLAVPEDPKMMHRLIPNSSFSLPRQLLGALPSQMQPFFTVSAASTRTDASEILLRNDAKSTGITSLTLNNPMKCNVLSWDMIDALQKQLYDIGSDSVRSLVS